ncbi:MAG TPA: ROK family transcriptional regulator [Pyrinomonadaceae bacterium]|jgi:predicted NBD/HSP70 family sugar kinase/predicted transcriptional regulator
MRRIDLKKAQVARSSTIRNINRQIVLNYVRDREPISRAEIARETALQRSTVSTIVEELKRGGLIEEIGEGESTGGRRPTLLRLRAAGAMAIGVDITPTCTTIATSDLAGRVLEREDFQHIEQPDALYARVIESVRKFAARAGERKIEGVGVSLPGLVDPDSGRAIYIPWFEWRNWPVADEISRATGLDVIIDNDANAAALAALWFGRQELREARDFIMVLVAEGIGTGIIVDGQIYRGERGGAGEFGHMIVGERGPVACSCGNHDCWEAFASGRAAVARYLQAGGDSSSNNNGRVDFAQVVDRALAGEARAIHALRETAHYLGIGISNLIVGLSPEAVVVGGPIARAWPLVGAVLGETIQRSVRRGLPSALIMPSVLGDHPTLMGALSLVLARKFASITSA